MAGILEGMSSPDEIATWMLHHGPVAAGLALEAFSHGYAADMYEPLAQAFNLLDPAFAKEVLQSTSVQSAGKVLAQMGEVRGAKAARALAEIPLVKVRALHAAGAASQCFIHFFLQYFFFYFYFYNTRSIFFYICIHLLIRFVGALLRPFSLPHVAPLPSFFPSPLLSGRRHPRRDV
jgi:hypothetical protein